MRFRLLSENKIGKYLRYAIGEIVLVVVGILIALSINNWNQGRIENRIEKRLLQELYQNLNHNEKTLRASISEEYKSIRSIEHVIDILENRLEYHDSMDYHFGRALYSDDIQLSTTAFTSLENRGFDIISSDSIRTSTVRLFDNEYAFLIAQTVRLEDQFWPSAVIPLNHKHFRVKSMEGNPFNDGVGVQPTDYNALLDDQTYHNMIKDRGHFRYQGASLKKDALDKTIALKDQIMEYLEMQN